MVNNKRKKNSRQRGTHTHGWGSKKKHRGAGNRGGRGMAGSGKRGDAKKPSILHKKNYFGKKGFKRNVDPKPYRIINLTTLERLFSQEADKELDLGKKGYTKLLGTGRITKKFKIKVSEASVKAVEKIKKSGGNVVTDAPQEPEDDKAPADEE